MANVFVPLNRFQSLITNLTGEEDEIYVAPNGVSSIMLSIQITNNSLQVQPVTILIKSNRELAIPNFEGVFSSSFFLSGSTVLNGNYLGALDSASALLSLNKTFIKKEAAAYINNLNNLSETPFTFTSSRFENYAVDAIDAIAYDVVNDKTIRTTKAAKAYYTKNGSNIIKSIYPEEYSSSLFLLDYVNNLATSVIKNQSVTGSDLTPTLNQTAFTQSFNTNFDVTSSFYSASAFVVDSLINVIKNTIQAPSLVEQLPIQLVTNATIPPADSLSPIVSGKLVLEEGYGFVVSGSPDLTVVLSILESANE
jgi:hypothetical protein